MLTLSPKLRAVVSLVVSLGKGYAMTISRRSEKTPRDGVRIYTEKATGRRYVDSDELIRSPKARKQMDQLRRSLKKRM